MSRSPKDLRELVALAYRLEYTCSLNSEEKLAIATYGKFNHNNPENYKKEVLDLIEASHDEWLLRLDEDVMRKCLRDALQRLDRCRSMWLDFADEFSEAWLVNIQPASRLHLLHTSRNLLISALEEILSARFAYTLCSSHHRHRTARRSALICLLAECAPELALEPCENTARVPYNKASLTFEGDVGKMNWLNTVFLMMMMGGGGDQAKNGFQTIDRSQHYNHDLNNGLKNNYNSSKEMIHDICHIHTDVTVTDPTKLIEQRKLSLRAFSIIWMVSSAIQFFLGEHYSNYPIIASDARHASSPSASSSSASCSSSSIDRDFNDVLRSSSSAGTELIPIRIQIPIEASLLWADKKISTTPDHRILVNIGLRAARADRVATLEYLSDLGLIDMTQVRDTTSGNTLLIEAAQYGASSTVRFLLSRTEWCTELLESPTHLGIRPLHAAILGAAKSMTSESASLSYRLKDTRSSFTTSKMSSENPSVDASPSSTKPFSSSLASHQYLETIQALLKAGAATGPRSLLDNRSRSNGDNSDNMTGITASSALNGSYDVEPNPFSPSLMGSSALALCVVSGPRGSLGMAIARLLLEHGSDPNERAFTANQHDCAETNISVKELAEIGEETELLAIFDEHIKSRTKGEQDVCTGSS